MGPSDPLKPEMDNSNWTSQQNDDKLIFKFDMSSNDSYIQDIWEWSVALSEPLGYAIDMAMKPDSSIVYDLGIPMFVRNGKNNRGGPLYQYDCSVQTVARGNGTTKTPLIPPYFLVNKTPFLGNPSAGYDIAIVSIQLMDFVSNAMSLINK